MTWLLGGVEIGELYHESVSGDINVLFSVESVHKNPRKILLKSLRSFVTILFFHGLHAGRNSEAGLQLSSGRRQVITSSEVQNPIMIEACPNRVLKRVLCKFVRNFSKASSYAKYRCWKEKDRFDM